MSSSNGLSATQCDWSNLTGVDSETYETAKKIESLAIGLTPKQFTEAISIALCFVNSYTTLLSSRSQPVPSLNEPD